MLNSDAPKNISNTAPQFAKKLFTVVNSVRFIVLKWVSLNDIDIWLNDVLKRETKSNIY